MPQTVDFVVNLHIILQSLLGKGNSVSNCLGVGGQLLNHICLRAVFCEVSDYDPQLIVDFFLGVGLQGVEEGGVLGVYSESGDIRGPDLRGADHSVHKIATVLGGGD